MDKGLAKKIENLNVELTKVLSVVGTKTELDISKKVYDEFMKMDYYKKHPELVKYVDFKNDKLERQSVVATLKGEKGNSKKTIVLIAHIDTVGISDYGKLKEYATKPEELAEKLKTVTLPEDARKDLESGDWLFGRGIFDMKCGVATFMVLIEYLSERIDEFEGNLVFAAVGDEEGNSGGMLSVVPELVKMEEEEGFEYLAVIDNDYSAERYEGDDSKYVYIGTVGKLMPSFYVVGKETHVGEPFKGLDPNQLAGAITQRVNLNVEYSDIAEGEVSLPPITLRQQDMKEEYSVQIAKTANLYFNYATHKSGPDEVMEKMKNAAKDAFEDVIGYLKGQYQTFCEKSGFPQKELPWKARVMSYQELYEKVKAEMGDDLDKAIKELEAELLKDETLDDRDFSLKLVSEVHSMWSDKDPVIIVYFAPPYYPHIYVEGSEGKEKKLLESVDKAVNAMDVEYNIVHKKFYPYISDLSYASAPKDDSVIAALKNNMPAFGVKYDLPLEDMQKLNLPVVNIGPFGKDAHKFTERLERRYSYEIAPKLVYDTIMNLLG
ncbi:M20/M25/M40 family metallo-hydrolase [Clostridiisalibacter paucivorans]|uniref:M20/M25/M40 family metallo-hydrolase n=1 Tax=Clostridiisalibacter paucivorans TaxID=408753 RepID=UPI00047BA398|nr:M20/M25/M40 family metallo-hydrolase [Clostridiisalibacter paucivorans]